MDIAYPKRPGQPPYSMHPHIVPQSPSGMTTISVNLPPNVPIGGTAAGGQNICHQVPAANPGANICKPLTTQQSAASNICNPKVATAPKPNAGALQLKPNTQMASAGQQPCNPKKQISSVQACESKPPFLPWGGHGSATITVSGGKPCGVGWHDTPGGPGGVTVLDSMTVTSQGSHGNAASQGHFVIYTPALGYRGQDSFTLSMQEHNGGRSATLSVKVSVTIQ
jgi:hypothetical protein